MKITVTKLIITGSLLLTLNFCLAQDDHKAPTLQVGLSGLSFSRGNLDAALVAEIVAEKQKEVKMKLIKNMLLNKLGVDNGLFYAFIDQNIEILLTEKDEDTRVKNLLENVVNLAFVVSYAEYYVAGLKPNSNEWNNFKNLALSFGVDDELFNKTKLSLKDFAKVKHQGTSAGSSLLTKDKQSEIRNRFIGVAIDLFAESVRLNSGLKSLGVLRTNYLQNYISMNAYLGLTDEAENPALHLLVQTVESQLSTTGFQQQIDVMGKIQLALQSGQSATLSADENSVANTYADQLRNSINALTIGITALPPDQKVFGEAYNENYQRAIGTATFNDFILRTYGINIPALDQVGKTQWSWLFRFLDAQFKQQFFSLLLNKKSIADQVFDNVSNNLDIHIKYFGLIKSLATKGKDVDAILNELTTQFPCGDGATFFSNIDTKLRSARASITSIGQLTASEKKALEEAGSFADRLKYIQLNRYEFMRQFEHEIRPSLISLSKYSLDFIDAGKNMEGFINCIQTTAASELKSINIDLNPSFITLFTKLDEFDKAETYAQFINHLSDAGDIFSDEEMRKSINKLLTFIRSYIKVTEGQNGERGLSLDVEGFLLNLQRIPYNRYSPISLAFTVGVNTAYFNKDLPLEDGNTLRNYSFIGEKIGVKFKLRDYKYLNSFSKGETFSYLGRSYIRTTAPREPVVSNIHILLYGSGLLYNLVNTGTTNDFNSPLVGAGLGVTFFNDLDLNISVGTPVVKNKAFLDKELPYYFNIGFDIQFIEYFNRLSEKRKDNQTQKKLSEASSN